ncbi:PfkB family carbohydrate kinase [Candidatus Margulisiibacteriota bacterium]
MEHIYNKIKTIDDLAEIAKKLKKSGKKIVHCHGVFDLVHPGHIRHLEAAKKEGDILIVTITADKFVKRGPGRPIFKGDLRAETLAAIGSVDYVGIEHGPTAINVIKKIKPNVYVKGQEYKKKDKDVTGKISDEEKAVKSVGGRLAFTYDVTFSSSKLINEYLDVYPSEVRGYLKAIAKKYSVDSMVKYINSVKKLKVLVIGDAIIDQYHYCESMGRSLKEPLVVSKYLTEESFAGGVFATANNTAGICSNVDLITVLGTKDTQEKYILKHLRQNIKPKFFYRADVPTTIKRRFVGAGANRKLFEVCYMEDSPISPAIERSILAYLKDKIKKYDLVIVSDFGHGLLTKGLIDYITRKSKCLALNVQTNSANAGFNFVTKYECADYVSIDEPEIRLAARDKHGGIKEIIKSMYKDMKYSNLMVTRGPQGSMLIGESKNIHETPAFATKVIDTIGAGDAFFAFTAPLMAKGVPQDLTSFIGNAVGALAVQIVCNRNPVEVVDLLKYITRLLK